MEKQAAEFNQQGEKMRDMREINRICFLAALCMFLSAVEMAIPKPLPFLRLGLANLPLLIALKVLCFREFIFLVVLKVLVQAIISGTLFSYIFLFSIGGTFASSMVMFALYKAFGGRKNALITNVGLSVMGAFANNLVQIGLSYLFMFGESTRYICFIILLFGFISGLLLGIIANIVEDKSQWIQLLWKSCGKTPQTNDGYVEKCGLYAENKEQTNGSREDLEVVPDLYGNIDQLTNGSKLNSRENDVNQNDINQNDVNPGLCGGNKRTVVSCHKVWDILLYCATIILLLVLMLVKVLYIKWICVTVLFVLVVTVKRKFNPLPSVMVFISVTLMALFVPTGKVLFTIGSWNITLGALETGLWRSAVLIGMVLGSKLLVGKNMPLPGRASFIMARVMDYYSRLNCGKLGFKNKEGSGEPESKKVEIISLFKALDNKLCEIFIS